MHKNTIRPSTSSAAHSINNHLTVVIGLADLLELRLRSFQEGNADAIQMVCKIREAATGAASATQTFSGQKSLEPSETYVMFACRSAELL